MNGEVLIIMLIEDNDDHAELVMRSFQENRVANTIIRISDGEEALDYLYKRGKFTNCSEYKIPNLVLLDLRLPKVDGLEVLKNIKSSENFKRVPVIILTSSEAEKDIAKSYDNHANSYLVKPLDFSKFTEMMNELGFYWLCWNKKPF